MTGFGNDYVKHGEELKALTLSGKAIKEFSETSSSLMKFVNKTKSWSDLLLESCLKDDEAKLLEDLENIFRSGASQSNPIQVTVLRNLMRKMITKNNTKYVDIFTDVNALHNNRLGLKNCALLLFSYLVCLLLQKRPKQVKSMF